MRGWRVLLAVAAMCTTGCSDPFAPQTSVRQAAVLRADGIRDIAGGLAAAMREGSVRDAVREAMRTSPFTEHKVSLSRFLHENPDVLNRASRAMGISGDQYLGLLSDVGELDFYAPYSQQRRTWRGGPDVLIAFSEDPDRPVVGALNPSGELLWLQTRYMPESTVFVLHPAEFKLERTTRRPAAPRSVIEGAEDGAPAGALIRRDPRGNIVGIVPLTVCYPPDSPECSSGGGGGGGGTSTKIGQFLVRYGDGIGSAEVEYTVTDDSHAETVRFTGIDANQTYSVNEYLWSGGLSFTGATNVYLVETDAFFNDDWGWGTYTTSMNGSWSFTEGSCNLIGDPNTTSDPACSVFPYTTVTSNFTIWW